MKIEIKQHPSQAVAKNEMGEWLPVFDDDGEPVPKFPQLGAVYVDGFCKGYIGPEPDRNLSLIVPREHLGPIVVRKIEQAVSDHYGTIGNTQAVMKPVEVDETDGEDEY